MVSEHQLSRGRVRVRLLEQSIKCATKPDFVLVSQKHSQLSLEKRLIVFFCNSFHSYMDPFCLRQYLSAGDPSQKSLFVKWPRDVIVDECESTTLHVCTRI